MILYCVIMFLTAVLFGALGLAIYRGRTDLIHDYHQTKVKDHRAYGRAFGKKMFAIAGAMLLSGIIGLFGDSTKIVILAIGVLVLGLCLGIGGMIGVQRKYNGGVF